MGLDPDVIDALLQLIGGVPISGTREQLRAQVALLDRAEAQLRALRSDPPDEAAPY